MKVLVSWLRDYVDVPDTPEAIERLASDLSMAGFEVAGIEPAEAEGPVPVVPASRDAVIDLEITANRPDCLNIIGIAREAATIYDRALRLPSDFGGQFQSAHGTDDPAREIDVAIDDPDLCPRYVVATAGVTVAPSPAWLAARLQATGVRPINNVVDVTNYVLMEAGHPMHAFDLERLAGPALRIRRARRGEKITTLDGVKRELEPDMLVIADAERPQAIAGVMGGADSEVGSTTRRIALESAYFQPASVRRTSKRLGLKSEASARFERGADPEAPVRAIHRVLGLLDQVGALRSRGAIIDAYPHPQTRPRLTLRRDRVARVLGAQANDAEMERLLKGLGFILLRTALGWTVDVPSHRVDVTREIDLVEEIARHIGYDKLPTTFPALSESPQPSDPRIARDRLVRQVLASAGFSEAVTFTFVEASAAAPFADGAAGAVVALANPLSEKFAVLRPSLLPGLVDAVAHNRRREQRDVRLFEIGNRFGPWGERRDVALAWSGHASAEHWSGGARDVDFFDVKGVVERLAEAFGATVDLRPHTRAAWVPGRTAEIVGGEDDHPIGSMGALTTAVTSARGVPGGDDVYAAELDLDALERAGRPRDDLHVDALPRHPSIGRDLSVVVDERLPAVAVRGTIRSAAPASLVDVREFDRYQGTGIPEGRVSVSFHLIFRLADRTLTDDEADRAMQAIVAALEREHAAVRR